MKMENGGKKLPNGVWIFIPHLPVESTSRALAEFITAKGFTIAAEQIQIRQIPHPRKATAMLSIPNAQVPDLLAWLLTSCVNGEKFQGRDLQFSGVSTWSHRRAA